MRRVWATVASCLLTGSATWGPSAFPCSSGGPRGAIDCTCVDWNAGQELGCPAVTDWQELAVPRSPPPERTAGGGQPPTPPGELPGGDLDQITFENLNNAKDIAGLRGRLRPYNLPQHIDYYPTACMELFTPYEGGFSNGLDVIRRTVYRDGDGYTWSNGVTYCDNNSVIAWTSPSKGYKYVYLCPKFNTLTPNRRAVTVIHEALHNAGLQEIPNPGGKATAEQISARIISTCGLQ